MKLWGSSDFGLHFQVLTAKVGKPPPYRLQTVLSDRGRQQQVSLGHLPSPFCVGLRVQQCQCPSLEVTAVGAQLAAAQVLC